MVLLGDNNPSFSFIKTVFQFSGWPRSWCLTWDCVLGPIVPQSRDGQEALYRVVVSTRRCGGIRGQQSHKTLQGRRGVGRDARAVRCRHPRPVAVELAARQRASGHDVVMPVDVCEPLVLCRQQAWGGATLCSQQREDAHCRASFFAPPPPSPALLRPKYKFKSPGATLSPCARPLFWLFQKYHEHFFLD